MSPSKALFFLCLSFIAGIFLSALGGPRLAGEIIQRFVWGIFVLGIASVFLSFFFKKLSFVVGFCLLFLVLGILRVQISDFNIANDKLSKLNGKGQVVLTGIVSAEPDLRDTIQRIKVKVNESEILVTTKRYPEYQYLDKIKLTGKLEVPTNTDTFNYQNYLMKDGIYSVMAFPRVEIVSQKHEYNIFSYLYEKILFFKQKLRESIVRNFSPPQSLIMEGTILGDNGAMTPDLKSKLNITGLRHVIAVSGTHVVILSEIIMTLLVGIGLWRGQAFYVAVFFICAYVILTGLPPSGVRAGIMGIIFLLSQHLGRQVMSSRLLTLACAIMIFINPLLLLFDVGFQLSFLAVLGLVYLEPIIKRFFKFLIKISDNNKANNFIGIVSTTLAAQIFTLPIMIYNFGNVSFVSPITNMLILPIVYWLMVFGFVASVTGVFSGLLGFVVAIPCWVLLSYFVKVIDLFSQPWMAKSITNVPIIWLVVLYIGIIVVTFFLNKKYKKNFI